MHLKSLGLVPAIALLLTARLPFACFGQNLDPATPNVVIIYAEGLRGRSDGELSVSGGRYALTLDAGHGAARRGG